MSDGGDVSDGSDAGQKVPRPSIAPDALTNSAVSVRQASCGARLLIFITSIAYITYITPS
jgi:hypothetical protein